MLDVLEHIDWVGEGCEVVVHLVEPGLVIDHFFEKHWAETSLPVDKAAPGSSSYVHLPVTNETETPVKVIDGNQLRLVKDVFCYEVKAMADDCPAERIVTSFVAFKNSHDQCEHVLLDIWLLNFVDVGHATFNESRDLLAGEAVY